MAAGDLDAAIDIGIASLCIIEHRGRAHADAHHVASARRQPFHQRMFQHGRADPAIIANGNRIAACLAQHGAEGAANGAGIICAQSFTNNAANVIFAQNGGIEIMRHFGNSGDL